MQLAWRTRLSTTGATDDEPVTNPHQTTIPGELGIVAHIVAAQRDVAAFAPLYQAYVDLVWRYAVSRLGDQQRAADTTSITFQRALAALPNFQPQRRGEETTFRSWLMTIARNVVIDQTRANRRLTILDVETYRERLADHAADPANAAVAPDEREQLHSRA